MFYRYMYMYLYLHVHVHVGSVRYSIGNVVKTASISMLAFFESIYTLYTCTVHVHVHVYSTLNNQPVKITCSLEKSVKKAFTHGHD